MQYRVECNGFPKQRNWLLELIENAATVLLLALTTITVRGPEKTKLNGPPMWLSVLNGVTTPAPRSPLRVTGKTTIRPDGKATRVPLLHVGIAPLDT
jgi:hypothetical protein